MRAFDNWISIEMHRLRALWRFFDQQQLSCMAYLEGSWNEPDEALDTKAVEGAHRSLNLAHEAKQLVDDRVLQLDSDPSAEVEPFLRRLYGNEDFRAAVASCKLDGRPSRRCHGGPAFRPSEISSTSR